MKSKDNLNCETNDAAIVCVVFNASLMQREIKAVICRRLYVDYQISASLSSQAKDIAIPGSILKEITDAILLEKQT